MITLWSVSILVVFIVSVATGLGHEEKPNTNTSHVEIQVFLNQSEHEEETSYIPNFEPDVTNLTLRKCFCDSGQAWNGSACEDTSSYVVMIQQLTGNTVLVKTTSFGNVTIGETFCPEGKKYEYCTENITDCFHGMFYILESGNLDYEQNIFDNYCIENVYGSHSFTNELFAQICVDPIPSCCEEGYSLDATGACVVSGNDIAPPVEKTEHPIALGDIKFQGVKNISCAGSEKVYIINIDYQTLRPFHGIPGWYLIWRSMHTFKRHKIYDFCVSDMIGTDQSHMLVAKFCHTDHEKIHEEKCNNRTCMRKCCEPNAHFVDKECFYDDSLGFQPVFHHPTNMTPGAREPADLTVVHGAPLCPKFYPQDKEDDVFSLLQNGYLHSPGFPEPIPPTKYCLESFEDQAHQIRMYPYVCFPPEENPICTYVQTYFYPILLIISAGFLAVTLVVYLSVPELHATVNGKCIISNVTAHLVAYLSLFTLQIISSENGQNFCRFMAFVTQISFLAAFFWLNVMCFDIWSTLRFMNPASEPREKARLRFRLYSLYSWGCPLVIAIVSVIIESLPEDIDVIRPGFGESRCWFVDNKSLWVYFYGFVLVLVIINIIFFVDVAYFLIVNHIDSVLQRTQQKNRERMWLYVKLFIVMGVTWLAEVISWQIGTCEAWMVFDFVNALQGFLIFLIFTYNKNHIKKMMSKCETVLRQVKESVRTGKPGGANNVPSKAGPGASEQLSQSVSELPSNHSATSNRTFRSQLSCESEPGIRKTSNGTEAGIMAAQVHAQDSIQMDPEAKSPTPKVDHCPKPKESGILPVDEEVEEKSHIDDDQREDIDLSHNGDNSITPHELVLTFTVHIP
ncbi:hypothetical protein SK128_013599 [Halocaridina rubra]|uniref:G-protein coupled receptors family 2 profile 2 domain-containing protein n=1 Tax=Halocaridina rubra TaxID=373956 RepID=A0AAN8ZTX7_HALRR